MALQKILFDSASGSVDGDLPILASGARPVIPRSLWIDKPADTTVEIFADISGNARTSSNKLLTIKHATAAMIYLEPTTVPAVSAHISQSNIDPSGSVHMTLYYQRQDAVG